MKIKEKIRAFGILLIRMFWPGKGSRGVQRLGILVLGIGAMMGITQAGTIGQFVSRAFAGAEQQATVDSPTLRAAGTNAPTAVKTSSSTGSNVDELFSAIPNVVDLLGESETILRGMVEDVTDGIENGVPYTEVTMHVTEQFRGSAGKKYTFRQFGLKAPRSMGNGKVNLNVTPAGWASYSPGEDVVLFLNAKARLTGLQTTVGLGQGKLAVKAGGVESKFGNVGLFENVEVDQKLLNDRDRRLLATKKGAVNAESFLSFVRKAAKGKWVEGGKLRHAKK